MDFREKKSIFVLDSSWDLTMCYWTNWNNCPRHYKNGKLGKAGGSCQR